MNRLLGMVFEVSLKPEERTGVCALIDCAEEELDLVHNAAVRYAVGVRRTAKWDLLTAKVKDILAIESKYYIDIREHVRDAMSLPARTYIRMTLHRKRDPIILVDPVTLAGVGDSQPSYACVSLNPHFVLRLRDILDQIAEEDRVKRDRDQRSTRNRRGGQHAPAS